MAQAADVHDAPSMTYPDAVRAFRPDDIAGALSGDIRLGINVCVECCDRHAGSGRVALRWQSQDGRRRDVTFDELRDASARFANLLADNGIGPGDVVSAMLPRTPELLVAMLGTWRAGAVYQPIFTAFGPKAIEHRFAMSGARLIVTDGANRAKLLEIPDHPPVLLVGGPDADGIASGDLDFHAELDRRSTSFEPVLLDGDALFLMMSTSGTTGFSKGVPVPIRALLAFHVYMRDAVDLRDGDTFWNIADPGWAYGVYYGVVGPLMMGLTTTFFDGPFTAESTYDVIERLGITNLAGSPTAFRLLMAAGPALAAGVKGRLRAVSSAGEPLNPEVIRWFAEHLGVPVFDHYGQTELGMVVCNHHRLSHPVTPGSAGFAMPGYRVAVLDEDGRELSNGRPGILAVDVARSPLLWFTGYWRQPTPAISGGYYRTGDTVELEPDGRISFVGRSDDVITSSGYRIGPFEVESALLEHAAVVEAAVIGKPDPERTEIVKAFVVLQAGIPPSEALAEELRHHVKRRLSAHSYPREIAFMDQLPKTPSGKLQRFVLRNEERAKLAAPVP